MPSKGKHETVITDKNLNKIEKLARDGYTDIQIARKIGIAGSTLYDWKKKYPEFSEALKRGKDLADEVAENALLMAATGYKYEEITREPLFNPLTGEPVLDGDGHQKIVITKILEKVAHPNTTALIFWLKNRKPHEWNDRRLNYVEPLPGDDEDDQI